MTEDFLHYLWRFKALKPDPWLGTKNELIELRHPGYHNSNSGPDFEQAQLRIGPNVWVGSVEIHLKSSDWNKHGHQHDPAYNNVILHVVYECDQEILCENGLRPPCLELKGLFDSQLYWRFEQRLQNKEGLACADSFPQLEALAKQAMLDRCAVLRLEEKSQFLEALYQKLKGDWQALFYHSLARSLGGKVNALAMDALAQAVPRSLWMKYEQDHYRRGILFLGAAGLLSANPKSNSDWQSEFKFLQHLHQIQTMEASYWKYSRMRPAAFPDRRIVQLAQILPSASAWFETIRQGSFNSWDHFNWPEIPEYWSRHYRLGRISRKALGTVWSEQLKLHVKINVLVPILFYYGHKLAKAEFKVLALETLQTLPPEHNKISRYYEQLGFSIRSAYDSQAVLAWFSNYCQPKKCLTCTLGKELLNQGS